MSPDDVRREMLRLLDGSGTPGRRTPAERIQTAKAMALLRDHAPALLTLLRRAERSRG